MPWSQALPPMADTATGYYAHILHRGVVQEDAAGVVTSPIPSLRRWILEWGGGPEDARAGG